MNKIVVVIDVNVAIDLQETSRSTATLSAELERDWLQEYISIQITDECFNEVNRSEDEQLRRRRRSHLVSFGKINECREKASVVLSELKRGVQVGDGHAEASDLRQLASAIAGNADVFCTHDKRMRKLSNYIFEVFGLRIMAPDELINDIDEAARGAEFAPVRLAAASLELELVKSISTDELARRFVHHKSGEKIKSFERSIRDLLAMAELALVAQVAPKGAEPIGLLGVNFSQRGIATVGFLRACSGRDGDTICHFLLTHAVRQAIVRGAKVIRLPEAAVDNRMKDVCAKLGFIAAGRAMVKLCASEVQSHVDARAWLSSCRDLLDGHERDCLQMIQSNIEKSVDDPDRAALSEHRLWPGKLLDTPLENYIVPIRPAYAAAMFDDKLAEGWLLGIDPSVALRCENVYYRSPHPQVIHGPGRVLWYVSEDSDRVKQIRGCSQILDIRVANAKSVYSQYDRLGVYSWADVESIAANASGKWAGKVMAIHFGLTEVFGSGIKRSRVEEIFTEEKQPMPPMSTVVRISRKVFGRLYQEAVNNGKG